MALLTFLGTNVDTFYQSFARPFYWTILTTGLGRERMNTTAPATADLPYDLSAGQHLISVHANPSDLMYGTAIVTGGLVVIWVIIFVINLVGVAKPGRGIYVGIRIYTFLQMGTTVVSFYILAAPNRDVFALVLAIAFIVIFTVAFPAFFTYKLITTEDKDVFAFESKIRFGPLWEQLKYNKKWFTSLVFWKRSIIAAIIGILAAGQGGAISLVICIIVTLAVTVIFMLPSIDPYLDPTTKITELVASIADIISFALAFSWIISYTDQNHFYTIIIASAQYLAWLTAIICYIIQWLRLEDVSSFGQLLQGGK